MGKARILNAASGENAIVHDRTVDARVKSLRHKRGPARDYIKTVHGAGYRFRQE
ncbi:MAG: winged helix-turn-helix transcriptional regulator [Phycisphaerales bacterium]|nr:MAG: winged helix-turn-helix transcriptional regulator [Phycisphaerales bacterium]